MSKIHTTLHKKGDSSVEIYPNIETENIPDLAITTNKISGESVTTAKISDGAITTAKLSSNSVTSGKLATNSVTNGKISDGAVTTSKLANGSVDNTKLSADAVRSTNIKNGAVNYDKLASDITQLFAKINRTYNLFVSAGLTSPVYFGNTTLSSLWKNYSNAEINDALDFDKSQIDYTEQNLDIIKIIIDGLYTSTDIIHAIYDSVDYGDVGVIMRKTSATNYQIHYTENNVIQFGLEFDSSTHIISSYTNTKTLYLTLKKAINFDVL